MTERLNVTTETGEGAVFSPGSEFVVQVKAEHPSAVFYVMGRVDAAADWELLGTIGAGDPFTRFAEMPFVKVAVRQNLAGKAAKAWSSV